MRLKTTIAWMLCIAASASTTAWAHDIQCATTRAPGERVICDHAILNNQYDDIAAQQQAMLTSGKISAGQLAQWRQSRNACADVHCIDTVFAQWKAMAASIRTDSAAATAQDMLAASAVGPVSDATTPTFDTGSSSALAASPTSEASLVRQGSAAGVALPQPVESASTASAVTPAVSQPNAQSSMFNFGAAFAAIVVLALALVAFAYRRYKSSGNKRT